MPQKNLRARGKQDEPKSPSRILLILAFMVIAVGILFQLLRSRDESTQQRSAPPQQPSASAEPSASSEEQEIESTDREPSLPFALREARVPKGDTPTATDAENPINGNWRVIVSSPFGQNVIGSVPLTVIEENRIAIGGEAGSYFTEFTLNGSDVGGHAEHEGYTLEFAGSFNSDTTELTGTMIQRYTDQMYSEEVQVRFLKLSEEEASRSGQLAGYRQETEDLFKALQAYFRAHDRTLPSDLNELVPEFLPAEAIAENSNREIIFDPNARMIFPSEDPAMLQANSIWGSAQEMIAHEQYLHGLRGDMLYNPEPVFTVRYEDGAVIYVADLITGIYQETMLDETGESLLVRGQDRAQREAAQRASCQNNMKQLALSAKMFAAEHPEDRYPPGFNSIYPEYTPDPAVLRCPAAERGTLSYQWVYPAATDAEMSEALAQVSGADPDPSTVQSRVPLLIETHMCAGDAGSNVVFVDGHAEFLTPEEFDEQIESFLRVTIH